MAREQLQGRIEPRQRHRVQGAGDEQEVEVRVPRDLLLARRRTVEQGLVLRAEHPIHRLEKRLEDPVDLGRH